MIGLRSASRSGSIALTLVAAASLAAHVPAARAATCPPIAVAMGAADVVFVGTLTATDSLGERASFAVEEVWKGQDVPAAVEVRGFHGQWEGTGALTGTRYLMLATVVGSSLQGGDGCNGPYLWDGSMAALRPDTAHPPESPPTSEGVPLALILVAGVVALLVGISLVAFRPTREPGA